KIRELINTVNYTYKSGAHTMIIVDAHEDLAYNVLSDGRNYLQSAYQTRAEEEGGPVPELNGLCTLGLPEWLKGNVALVFGTLFTMPRQAAKPGEMGYPNPESAHQQALAQLNIYRRWAAGHPQITLVSQRLHLEQVLATWSDPAPVEKRQVGLVLLMENAAPIRTPDEAGWWYEQGVRLIGPAWRANRYSGSSDEQGPLTELGRQLLAVMEQHRIVLDLSHMSDSACLEALATYSGPIVATHSGLRRLVPTDRLLPDEIVAKLVARDGVVGIMPANWALDPDWRQGNDKKNVKLKAAVRTIDAVCQLAGDAHHVGIGTDFDGGFGAEAIPAELDTIGDLPRLVEVLAQHGYSQADIEAIMGGNWLRLLRQALPD
ncbi:MAG TPA: membrane dipeptidase, partial [Anaerolineae bacterium]